MRPGTRVLFDGGHGHRAAAGQFVRDRPGTGKQIEGLDALEVNAGPQEVEQPFPTEIGGGTAFEMAGRRKPAPFERAPDYAHRMSWMSGRNCCR